MELLALTLALFSTMWLGLAQVVGKLVLKNMGSMLFNAIRFAIASPILIFSIFLIGGPGNFGGSWALAVAVLSTVVGQFFATYLFFYSMKREAAHRIVPVGNSQPFWVIAFSSLFLGEQARAIILITAVLVFVGSFLLVPKRAKSNHCRAGIIIAALAALLWGLSVTFSKYCFNTGMTVPALLLLRILLAAALFSAVAFVGNRRRSLKIHRRSVGLCAVSGIAFLVGTFMYLTALNLEQASTLAPITGTTILFGSLFSILLVGEKPTKKSILGAILIFAGILLIAI